MYRDLKAMVNSLFSKTFASLVNISTKRFFRTTGGMAKSKFEYVKVFENHQTLLPNCWIIVRVDGKGFHKFADKHQFEKPNDLRGLQLMNRAALTVMEQYLDIVLAYGQSDEYSFVFRKDSILYNRRIDKIISTLTSLFTSSYVFHWKKYFENTDLLYPPSFDGRCVLYPSDQNLIDYLSWRQADVHINNLYNTTFWNLVLKAKMTPAEAEKFLSGTLSADKNEILFSKFSINYNNEPVMFKKGTTLLRKNVKDPIIDKNRKIIIDVHEDMIQENFWKIHYELLEDKKAELYNLPSISIIVDEQLQKKRVVRLKEDIS